MWSNASRAFLLLNGGCSQFGLSHPCVPRGSKTNVCKSGFCSILGMKSSEGSCHQSTLPVKRSSAASQGSGMYRQITSSAEALGELERERLPVNRSDFPDMRHEELSEAILLSPALQGFHTVFREDDSTPTLTVLNFSVPCT
jgi:hypothetical protein